MHGWDVVATNAWVAGNELDLVAVRRGTVAVCEVKSKSSARFGDPLEMVTPEKIRRLRRAAEAWLAWHPEHAGRELRFDVIVERGEELEHLPNAF